MHQFDPVGWQHAARHMNTLRDRFGEEIWTAGIRELSAVADMPGEGPDVPPGHAEYPCRGCIDRWAKRAAKIMTRIRDARAR